MCTVLDFTYTTLEFCRFLFVVVVGVVHVIGVMKSHAWDLQDEGMLPVARVCMGVAERLAMVDRIPSAAKCACSRRVVVEGDVLLHHSRPPSRTGRM